MHLDLDGAWDDLELRLPRLDLTDWGPKLRFSAPPRVIADFYSFVQPRLSPFLLYGSGDFHHLSALWLRRLEQELILLSFDNHPDWDVRPPRWCCGGWINRALELPHVRHIAVWGCGNFECWWPHQIFGNRRAERGGRLEVHPWADDRPLKDRGRRGAILRENWRDHFDDFVQTIRGANVYVTIDLDCLARSEAITNWENGRFEITDLVWALEKVRASTNIIAGDICGAFSAPVYARRKQRFASEMDHPKFGEVDLREARRINRAALAALWPVLTQRDNKNSDTDQDRTQN